MTVGGIERYLAQSPQCPQSDWRLRRGTLKPAAVEDRLRRFAEQSRHRGREQVPATRRPRTAHQVPFIWPDTKASRNITKTGGRLFSPRLRSSNNSVFSESNGI